MEIINLGEKNSIFNHFISEIRNIEIQIEKMDENLNDVKNTSTMKNISDRLL